MVPVCWRLRVDGALPGFENMRIDEEILEAQRAKGALPVLRFFRWKEPTLSFGRLQDAASAQAEAAGAAVVRRPTGGGMVLHRDDLSFSLAWRRDHPVFPRCLGDVYRMVHEAAQAALKDAGADTQLQPPGPARAPGVCFSEPVEHDLMRNGRKILGGAIRATAWGRLYQGNLLPKSVNMTAEEAANHLKLSFQKNFFRQPPET